MSSMRRGFGGAGGTPASVMTAVGAPGGANRRTVMDPGAKVNGVEDEAPQVRVWVGARSGSAWYGTVDVSQT
jgi:hypothetical protein